MYVAPVLAHKDATGLNTRFRDSALGRRMNDDADFRHGRLQQVGVLIRWVARFLILEILLRRGVPIIWRKYQERRGRR